jgi:hypothetical protein
MYLATGCSQFDCRNVTSPRRADWRRIEILQDKRALEDCKKSGKNGASGVQERKNIIHQCGVIISRAAVAAVAADATHLE